MYILCATTVHCPLFFLMTNYILMTIPQPLHTLRIKFFKKIYTMPTVYAFIIIFFKYDIASFATFITNTDCFLNAFFTNDETQQITRYI